MGLTGEWIRRLLRASGTALVLPILLLVGAAALAGGGGLGGLGALGQLITGPPLPAAEASTATPATAARLVRPAPAGRAVASTSGSPTSTPGVRRRSTSKAPTVRRTPRGVGSPRRGAGAPTGGGAGGSGGGSSEDGGCSSCAPEPPSSTLDQVGDAIKENGTDRLPPPVGPVGSEVVDTVTGTLDGILPPGPR